MYELIQLTENSYYIQSPAKIGLVKLNDTLDIMDGMPYFIVLMKTLE